MPAPRPRQGTAGTAPFGYLHCGPSGAGHFVKMVHNGIEYGVMAAYAEGMNILKSANAGKRQAHGRRRDQPAAKPAILPVRHRPAAGGRGLAAWQRHRLLAARPHGRRAEEPTPALTQFGGRVSDSGEGRWTLKAAIDTGVPAPVLSSALFDRFSSQGESEFADKLLSAMRYAFGGHVEKPKAGM